MTELERALVALGNELDFPAVPDLTSRVRERLQRRRWVRPVVFAVALGALALGVAMAVPPARSAILKFFHIGSATVEQVETLPPAQQRPITAGLGPVLSKSAAEAKSGVRITLPKGSTSRRFYAYRGLISTLLRVDGKPVLLSEMRGDQMGLFKKFVAGQTEVRPVRLGEFGLWIHGGPHVVMWQVNYGPVNHVQTRLAGEVVLWLSAGTTYRLEGPLDLQQMLELAREITP